MTETEKALLFGEGKSLVGIVTDPPETAASGEGEGQGQGQGDRPGVVILNAGIVHRVGPNRLHVKLARRLARAGYVVMRFDFSGIGDSKPRRDGQPFEQTVLAEIRSALDYLASSRGVTRFVLVGLCSGADNALRGAARDPRVSGAVIIEGHAVPTTAYLRHLYRKKLLRPSAWLRLFSGRSELWQEALRILKRSVNGSRNGANAKVELREQSLVPSRSEVVSSLRTMGERGARTLLIYSEGSPSHFFYRKGVRRKITRLSRRGIVTTHMIRGADHIFTERRTQTDLLTTIFDWTRSL